MASSKFVVETIVLIVDWDIFSPSFTVCVTGWLFVYCMFYATFVFILLDSSIHC